MSMTTVRRAPTAALGTAELEAIRSLMEVAFGPGDEAFGEADWQHTIGGLHFLLELEGRIVSHAAVVERLIEVGSRRLRTGYVEAVATAPDRQGQGLGTLVMEAASEYIREAFELGALGTGSHRFYERLGWRTWQGHAFVRLPEGPRRTPDDEGYILVLSTPSSPAFEGTEPISCDWRPGDVW